MPDPELVRIADRSGYHPRSFSHVYNTDCPDDDRSGYHPGSDNTSTTGRSEYHSGPDRTDYGEDEDEVQLYLHADIARWHDKCPR